MPGQAWKNTCTWELFHLMLLGIYPRNLKTYVQTNACTQRYTPALFIIVKTQKQSRCPIHKGINKLVHLITIIWGVKSNDLSSPKIQGGTLNKTPWTIQPWNSPGQNTGVGSLSLLQGIFPTQGSNPGLLHCRQLLYQLSHKGIPEQCYWVQRAHRKGYILQDSNPMMTSWKRQNYGDSRRISFCRDRGKEVLIGWAQKTFRMVKLPCMTL